MASLAPPRPPRIRARSRLCTRPRRIADVAGVGVLLLLTVIATWPLIRGGTMVGLDSVAFFYPMWHFLGTELRAFQIPGWNPYQFSGVPFAADPESGWMYLPAMLLFALLPFNLAAKAFILGHLLLAGLGTYALGRVLRLSVVGALVAAVAFEFSGFFYDRSACCPAHVEVAAWLPVLLLGAELALRGESWPERAGWWGVSGFCLSQILGGWLGQGAYYALLLLGGFLAYRTLLAPPPALTGWRQRAVALAATGAGILVFGFGLAAAGVLPRITYSANTNLAHGYVGNLAWAADLGGWTPRQAFKFLMGRQGWYIGGAVVVLALMALPTVRLRHAAPAFAVLSIATLLLAAQHPTPLTRVLDTVLPRFRELTTHWPERGLVIFYLGPALLAGATVTAIGRARPRDAPLFALATLPVALLAIAVQRGQPVPHATLVAFILAAGALLLVAALPTRSLRMLIPLALLVLVTADLLTSNFAHVGQKGFHKIDLAAYYAPTGATRFLLAQEEGQPFRYLGYDPSLAKPDWDGEPALYRYQFLWPYAARLMVNNRATYFGLQDIQGYNPLQPQQYVDFFAALNGHFQEYHGAYVFPSGVDSPLLDLLNVRYVVVPTALPPSRGDLRALRQTMRVIYRDKAVTVLENPAALPRAWVVHQTRQVFAPEALSLLTTGAIDPRTTALLETAAPPLARSRDPTADQATVTSYAPDRIQLTTRTDAASLLMLSEPYDPDWTAYVDDKPVTLYRADALLRAVPVPAGTHTVELRYEPRSLQIGLIISGLSAAALVGVLALWLWCSSCPGCRGRWRRRGPRHRPDAHRGYRERPDRRWR